jgi:phosphoribosyl 1,2-cyclic phosphate phosphodiesterase
VSEPSLKITFLGTGTSTGIPMIACGCEVCTSKDPKDNRLRSSVLIESSQTTLVIDTTPDFRQQMLRIDNKKLDAVLFTHPHKDHIAGLDDVRAYNFFQQKTMNVYANEITTKALQTEFAYAFAEHKYPGVPDINLITIDNTPFAVNDIWIMPFNVWHHKMPVNAYRFGNFTYITDANRIDEAEKNLIRGSDVVVLNALRQQEHVSHFTLTQAIDLIDELEIPKAYLTHISHQLGLHEVVSKTLPSHIQLAFDGLQFSL